MVRAARAVLPPADLTGAAVPTAEADPTDRRRECRTIRVHVTRVHVTRDRTFPILGRECRAPDRKPLCITSRNGW